MALIKKLSRDVSLNRE